MFESWRSALDSGVIALHQSLVALTLLPVAIIVTFVKMMVMHFSTDVVFKNGVHKFIFDESCKVDMNASPIDTVIKIFNLINVGRPVEIFWKV